MAEVEAKKIPACIRFDASGGRCIPLEDDLRAQLEHARIESTGDLELIASAQIVAETAILA